MTTDTGGHKALRSLLVRTCTTTRILLKTCSPTGTANGPGHQPYRAARHPWCWLDTVGAAGINGVRADAEEAGENLARSRHCEQAFGLVSQIFGQHAAALMTGRTIPEKGPPEQYVCTSRCHLPVAPPISGEVEEMKRVVHELVDHQALAEQ